MDMFEWLYEAQDALLELGEGRLAQLLEEIPSAAVDGRHEEAERLAVEGLAVARSLKNPWIEVFLRHWRLQSRVLHRLDVSRDTLQEAVSLVEFASHDNARDCPQSICSTQDLTSCYGTLDGPGFVHERIAAADETLARITPEWPCYDCISTEKASAILDDRRFEEALTICNERLRDKHTSSSSDLHLLKAYALLALERPSEALDATEAYDTSLGGDTGIARKQITRTLCLARLGRLDEAAELLLSPNELQPQYYLDWLRCVRELAAHASSPNSWRLEQVLADMSKTIRAHDSRFTLAKLHTIGTQLAVLRCAPESAQRHLASAKKALEPLRKPEVLKEALASLTLEVEALPRPEVSLPTTQETFLELGGQDPEAELPALRAAVAAWPGARGVVLRCAGALQALFRHDESAVVLEAGYAAAREDEEIFEALVQCYLENEQESKAMALCAESSESLRIASGLSLARCHARAERWADAKTILEGVLDDEADRGMEVRGLLIGVSKELGLLGDALMHLNVAVNVVNPGLIDWERMLIGAQLGEWADVRDSAARLGIELSNSDGPIAEEWEACLVRPVGGRASDLVLAQRTGPVSATLYTAATPGGTQRYRDEVLIDGSPLNLAAVEEASDAPEGERPLMQFAAVHVVKAGGYRAFALDGLCPTDDEVAVLHKALEDVDVVMQVKSSPDSYRLFDSQSEADDESLPGFYACLAAPSPLEASKLHEALVEATTNFAKPLTWLELASELADSQEVARQDAICERFGIVP